MRVLLFIAMMFFMYGCKDAIKVEYSSDKEQVQHSEDEVMQAVYDFNKSLETKDTAALKGLLADNLSYGHSNGWVQSKDEVIDDLFTGLLSYHKIDQPELRVIMNDDIATVRGNGIFDVDYKDSMHMMFDLHVMQTWIWRDGKWKLLNRQSMSNKN